NATWTPIGPTDAAKFTGIYDGGNKTILAQNINYTISGNVYPSGDISAAALFGCVYGTVQNVTVSGLSYTATTLSRNEQVAPLVAFLGKGAKLVNAHSKNCTINMGAYTGYLSMGGLVAEIYAGTLDGCSSDKVTLIGGTTGTGVNAFIGGMYGSMDTCTVRNSTANADITLTAVNSGQIFVGGFGGAGNSTNGAWLFENCSAAGTITANVAFNGANAQGIAGFAASLWMPSASPVSIRNCSTTTKITSSIVDGQPANVLCGGFIGNNALASLTGNAYVNNTYTADCKYLNKVGANSPIKDAQITDPMIRLAASPITISKLMLDPPEGAWVSGSAGVGLQANIT
ncbi:MAG: hypothetical protein RSB97_08505, partial [Christensenella sp.]